MKVYLDDERNTPAGWTRTWVVETTVLLLETRGVTHLSLDNDLGEGNLEGFKVLDWLEEKVYNDPEFPIPEITIHSANPVAKHRMQQIQRKLELWRRISLHE